MILTEQAKKAIEKENEIYRTYKSVKIETHSPDINLLGDFYFWGVL